MVAMSVRSAFSQMTCIEGHEGHASAGQLGLCWQRNNAQEFDLGTCVGCARLQPCASRKGARPGDQSRSVTFGQAKQSGDNRTLNCSETPKKTLAVGIISIDNKDAREQSHRPSCAAEMRQAGLRLRAPGASQPASWIPNKDDGRVSSCGVVSPWIASQLNCRTELEGNVADLTQARRAPIPAWVPVALPDLS